MALFDPETVSSSFLKKKNQKTFLTWCSRWVIAHATEQKFLLLFLKRSAACTLLV